MPFLAWGITELVFYTVFLFYYNLIYTTHPVPKEGVYMRDFDWYVISTLHETKHITRTAELLYTTQPTITKRLQAIEQEMQCQIVLRGPKGVEFTPAGNKIVEKAQIIINTMQEIKQEIVGDPQGKSGTLYLGVPYSYVRFVLPTLLEEYTVQYPNVHIDIRTALSDDLVEGVQDGKLDICFARYTIEDESLCRDLISVDQSYAVYNRPFCLEDLPNIPYIEFEKNIATKAASREWWKQHFQIPQKIRLKVTNADTCLSMIEHNLGYGIFPDKTYFMNDKRFYSIPLVFQDGSRFTRKTWMLYRKETKRNPVAANFIQFINCFDMDRLWNNNSDAK